MHEIFLNSFILCFCFALIACIYILFLSKQPVLNWWFMFGLKHEKKWFYNIVWGCQHCFGGQLCLWFTVITHFKPVLSLITGFLHYGQGNCLGALFLGLFWLVFRICLTMLFTLILSKILNTHKIV